MMDTPLSLPNTKDILEIDEIEIFNNTPGPYTDTRALFEITPSLLNLASVLHSKHKSLTAYEEETDAEKMAEYHKALEEYDKRAKAKTANPEYYLEVPPEIPMRAVELKGTEVIIFPGLNKFIQIPFSEFKILYMEFLEKKQTAM